VIEQSRMLVLTLGEVSAFFLIYNQTITYLFTYLLTYAYIAPSREPYIPAQNVHDIKIIQHTNRHTQGSYEHA